MLSQQAMEDQVGEAARLVMMRGDVRQHRSHLQ